MPNFMFKLVDNNLKQDEEEDRNDRGDGGDSDAGDDVYLDEIEDAVAEVEIERRNLGEDDDQNQNVDDRIQDVDRKNRIHHRMIRLIDKLDLFSFDL